MTMSTAAYPPHHRDSTIVKIVLPVGRTVSSQIKFSGSPPKITHVANDCPLHGVQVGQTICGVGIGGNDDDGYTMDPTCGFVQDMLHEFSWSEERVLLLGRSPPLPHATRACSTRAVAQIAPHAQTKSARAAVPHAQRARPVPGTIRLPAGHIGLWFEGSPAVLTDVSAGTSPVSNEAERKIGCLVTAIKVPGEIEIYGMLGTDELVDILDDFSDVEGRAVVFEAPASEDARVQRGEPAELVAKVHLAGSTDITFRGRPPVVASVEGDSHLARKVKVGMVVQRLEFPGESPYWASLGAKTLNVLLQHHAHVKGKVLVVSYPSSGTRSNSSAEKKRLEETHKRSPSFKAKDIRTSLTQMKGLARA